MIDKELLTRFWRDFQLITQEEDSTFPIVNPQDAARALIKCRNWIGTFTEQLITLETERTFVLKDLHRERVTLRSLDNFYIERILASDYPLSAIKNKDILQALIQTHADAEQKALTQVISNQEEVLLGIESDKTILENLIKRIEKSTDWLIQYLNWTKFELRSLQN